MIGIVVVVGLIVLYLVFSIFLASRAVSKRPHFYEELQTALREILIPLGFDERNGPGGRARSVIFSRDIYSITLLHDIMDSLYHVTVATNSETDFSLDGHISEADKLKSDTIKELNDWLVKQDVR